MKTKINKWKVKLPKLNMPKTKISKTKIRDTTNQTQKALKEAFKKRPIETIPTSFKEYKN